MTKKTVTESKRGLAFLIENTLEQATIVKAGEAILKKLQDMAEDLAKIEADDIMPILDSMRLTFGPELTDSFNDVTTAKIRQCMDTLKSAKQSITTEVGRLENTVNGDPTNDLGMDASPVDPTLDGDMGGDGDLDVPPMPGAEGELGSELDAAAIPGDDAEMDPTATAGDLDAAFADAGDNAAGRARKESVQRNIKALSESKNGDLLIYETFKRTLKETRAPVQAAEAVARAFAIDYQDVVAAIKESAVKEGKSKHSNDKKNKNPFAERDAARKQKKDGQEKELEEGKSRHSDDKKNKNPFAERDAARKAKTADRAKELEEGKSKHSDENKNQNPFAERNAARKAKTADRAKELEEGKSKHSDENKNKNPFADRDAARKKKQSDRDKELEEGKKSFKTGSTAGKPSGAKVDENAFNRIQPRKTLSDMRTRTLDVASQQDGEARASADYKSHLNRSMEVPYIYAFDDQEVVQIDSHIGDPIVVRVEPTEIGLIYQWHEGGLLEPRWKVSVVNGQGVVPANMKRGYIDAPSYRLVPQRKR